MIRKGVINMKKFLTLSIGIALFFSVQKESFLSVIASDYSDVVYSNSSATVPLVLPLNFPLCDETVAVEVMIFPNLPPPISNETIALAIPAEITPNITVQAINPNIYLIPSSELSDVSFSIRGLTPGLYYLYSAFYNIDPDGRIISAVHGQIIRITFFV
jgi:hypothetical protein